MQELTNFFGKYFIKKEDRKAAHTKKKPLYRTCEKEEGHAGESLNLVCLDKKCDSHGLICSLCRASKHLQHTVRKVQQQVIPLKTLLEDLEKSIDADNASPEESLNNLEYYYNNMMGNLSSVVESMAQWFRRLEKQIRQEYSQQRHRVKRRYQLQQDLPQTIDSIFEPESNESIREEILGVLECLSYSRSKSCYVIGTDPKQLAKDYQKKQEKIGTTLFQLMELFTSKTKDLDEYLQKTTVAEDDASNIWRFSETLKSKCIVLSEETLQAKQNQSKNEDLRFAVIEPALPLHRTSKISFQVKNLANWIGVGICFKDIITLKNYKFDYGSIGHGSYLMSSNGYVWSNSNAAENIKQNGFSFQTGSSVTVEFDPINKKVIYTMEADPHPHRHEQTISLAANPLGAVHFCANLCSKNDEIRIL